MGPLEWRGCWRSQFQAEMARAIGALRGPCRSPEKISDPLPMISARLRCPYQWARLDGQAARIAGWSMGSLQGQKVVVIGGSRGVGRSIVEAALSEGATVLAVARGAEALVQLSNETPGVKTLAVDATKDTAPDLVFAALEPDVLVICAGALAPSAPVHELTWEGFSVNWEMDVKASFLFCKAALRGPLKPGTRVVLISSGAAWSGGPPFAGGYGGAKRAQVFLAGHCQKESDRLGLDLRFMALAPTRIMPGTGVGEAGMDGYAAYTGIQPADFLAGMTDMHTPADVAQAVVELATGTSEGSSFTVTGSGLAQAA
jgi:NAD(P)-dependent dehydrogenase (short-subunit alcohol dehydrogenase family)